MIWLFLIFWTVGFLGATISAEVNKLPLVRKILFTITIIMSLIAPLILVSYLENDLRTKLIDDGKIEYRTDKYGETKLYLLDSTLTETAKIVGIGEQDASGNNNSESE